MVVNKSLKSLLIVAGVGLALFVTWIYEQKRTMVPTLSPDDAATVARGKDLYTTHCAACHGGNLEGERDWRRRNPDGKLPAPPHNDLGHTWHHTADTLFAITKYGPGALTGSADYQSNMPAYGEILSDREIIDVLSYIKSEWPLNIRLRHDQMENAAREKQ